VIGGLHELSAAALRQGYLRREVSPVEVLPVIAERIERAGRYNAFITPLVESALEKARRAEDVYRRGEGDSQPLLGVPIAVKDNYDTAQIRTTCGSSIFAGYLPRETAECVRRAEAAGAIVVGKTNLHEFAWGITGINPHFGSCRNPWNPAHVAGGSSSGSAAAVALMAAPLALGSDTAGSIRIPAGFCGVVGFKPTCGRLPRTGLFPLAPTLDHVGLLAREPGDVALLLRALDDRHRRGAAGAGEADDGRVGDDVLRGLRVGVLPASSLAELDDDVAATVRAAVDVVVSQGAEPAELDAGLFAHALGTLGRIQQAEAFFAHHSRGLFPARADEYGADVRLRLELAESVAFTDYLAAMTARDRLADQVRALFEAVDVLLTPLGAARTPTLASLSDETTAADFRRRTLIHTVPQSLTGIPSCAVRAGFDRDGLPVGVQLSSPHGTDERLLQIAEAFCRCTPSIQGSWPAD
jgi:aspartyl-tRNA(Asn)/glutamyl-tRNA(Gln) amidotransferase subunit A